VKEWAILFGVFAAIAQTAIAQNQQTPQSTEEALARRAEYGLRWHRFWHFGENMRSARQSHNQTAVAFLLNDRWVVMLSDSRIAISILTAMDGNVIGPIIEIDESDVYGTAPDQALEYYLSLHAPQNPKDCVGVVAEGGANHPEDVKSASKTLPLARPCGVSTPWTVRASWRIPISSEIDWVRPPPSTSQTRTELTTLVRSWSRMNLPAFSGTMVIPSVFADVDPRVYVYLSGNGIEGILVLQREENGQITAFKLLERPESVARYLGRIEPHSPFKMPW